MKPHKNKVVSALNLDAAGVETIRPRIRSSLPRILLISTTSILPYRVLRCARASGALVFALGNRGSQSLKYSRYCEQFILTEQPIDGTGGKALADEINAQVERLDIDVVLPGDAPATRSIILLRDHIRTKTFPLPKLEQFDLLNDKWDFHCVCKSLEIRVPDSRLFQSVEELCSAIERKEVTPPVIAKPLSMDGGVGCVVVELHNTKRQLKLIDYAPIIVQRFVCGEDIGAGVLCNDGRVAAFIAHRYHHDTYQAFRDDMIYLDLEKLARRLELDGVFNFDMRRDSEGRVFYLECNPRFYFKIAMSMIAGVDFISLGLRSRSKAEGPVLCASATVRFPKALMFGLFARRKIDAKSWQALKFVLADPLPYIREEVGLGAGRPWSRICVQPWQPFTRRRDSQGGFIAE